MNCERNELEQYAWEKIKNDSKYKPNCCFVGGIGPTGPAGVDGATGPTGTYDYFFNKINRNYSSIFPFKYKKYHFF